MSSTVPGDGRAPESQPRNWHWTEKWLAEYRTTPAERRGWTDSFKLGFDFGQNCGITQTHAEILEAWPDQDAVRDALHDALSALNPGDELGLGDVLEMLLDQRRGR